MDGSLLSVWIPVGLTKICFSQAIFVLGDTIFDHSPPSFAFQFLDGADIRGLDLTWLRSQHAVVSHRCFLPHYSIADNIAYGNDNGACALTRREIEDAAYSAYAHEFIMALSKVSINKDDS